jgi:hypothetical protein
LQPATRSAPGSSQASSTGVVERVSGPHPDWAVSGEADHAVDQVLELVEMLVGRPEASA